MPQEGIQEHTEMAREGSCPRSDFVGIDRVGACPRFGEIMQFKLPIGPPFVPSQAEGEDRRATNQSMDLGDQGTEAQPEGQESSMVAQAGEHAGEPAESRKDFRESDFSLAITVKGLPHSEKKNPY